MNKALVVAAVVFLVAGGPFSQRPAAAADCLAGLRAGRLYSVSVDGVTYTVTNVPGDWGARGRRAFFNGDVLVRDPGLAYRLAVTAWVKETLVDATLAPFAYSRSPVPELESIRGTFLETWRNQVLQDLFIRMYTDAGFITLAQTAVGPIRGLLLVLPRAGGHAAVETARSNLRNPETFLRGVALAGVIQAISDYEALDSQLIGARQAAVLDVAAGERMFRSYVAAVSEERSYVPLMAALLPRSLGPQFARAIRSITLQALSLINPTAQSLDMQQIVALRRSIDNLFLTDSVLRSLPYVAKFIEGLRFGAMLVKTLDSWIADWANTAVGLCLETIAGPTPAVTTAPTGLSVLVRIAPARGPAGMRFTITWTGFSPNSTLTSHLQRPDGAELPSRKYFTNENGSASTTIDTTGFVPGRYAHWAIDDRTGRATQRIGFAIIGEVAASPMPILPGVPSGPTPAGGAWDLVSVGGGLMNPDITRPSILRAQLELDGRVIATASSSHPVAHVVLSGQVLSVSRGRHTVTVRIVDQAGGPNTYETIAMQIQAFSGGTLATFILGNVKSSLATGQAISYAVDLR